LILARLCTLNDCLVQGANTSPILANLACIGLDQDLYQIALENICSYSRYADDITFSGDKIPKTKAIDRCLEKYGFQLNPEKWKCQRRGNIQYVTGLTVFDDTMPRLPKKVKRDLRQSLYYAEKYGLASHLEKLGMQDNMQEYINRIDGLIAFMYSVELECAYKFDTIWQEIRLKTNIPRSRHPSKILDKYRLRENLECSKST
jgi:RNA-directed DNA polymerase